MSNEQSQETIETIGNDVVNEKLVKEKEKELLQKFKPIFYEYLHDHVDLQVISVYAMQSAWFALKTPKGKSKTVTSITYLTYYFIPLTNPFHHHYSGPPSLVHEPLRTGHH